MIQNLGQHSVDALITADEWRKLEVQKRIGSEEVEPITPQWLRTGSGGGVASAQTGLQLFYNYFTI